MSQNPENEIHQFEAPSLEKVAALLPNYTFEAFIAKGGMGAVYKATQTSLDRPVAIKILPTEFGDDEEFRESFQTEAKLMARLNHPNLITVFDFGEIEGMLYIVMELVDGQSLYEATYETAIRQETAIKFTRDICDGLDHAHQAGILHRDIKPANILLKGENPKIGDFGLARPTGNAETGAIFGTPGYTAPEVIANPAAVDKGTDIFSVGILFYELLTGNKPETAHSGSVNDYIECHPDLNNIIKKAIRPDIRNRYASAAEMSEELTQVLRDLKEGNNTSSRNTKKLITRGSTAVQVQPATRVSANKSTPATPKLTTSTVQSTPALATSPAAASSQKTAQPAPIASATKSPVTRNILIIIILLIAIYITNNQLSQKEKDTQAAEAKHKLEQQAKEEERLKALAKYNAVNPQTKPNPKPNNEPQPDIITSNDPEPDTPQLTHMEQLEELRRQLVQGNRPIESMPPATFMLSGNTRMLLVITKSMTWHEADRYARKHGGYLATLRSPVDTTLIISKLPENSSVWLGAGTTGNKNWAWSDGTPTADTIELGKNSKHRFISIGEDGYPTPTEANKQLSFVIEWRMDGSNPGSIENRLKRTNETLSQLDASYPPGTVSSGSRHYYLASERVNLNGAKKLARMANARLYVPSTPAEADFVNEFIVESLPHNKKAWIGGQLKNGLWTWLTGETWSTSNWDESYPKRFKGLAIVPKSGGSWQDFSIPKKLDFVLLEWSQDKADGSAIASNKASAVTNEDIKKLIEKANTLIEKEEIERENNHKKNIKDLVWDIDTYFRSLSKNLKLEQQEAIQQIKDAVDQKARLPQTISSTGPSAKVRQITLYGYNKQLEIDKNFLAEINKIRIGYIGQLEKLAADFKQKNQVTALKSVEDEIENSGNTAEKFLDHFGSQ